jgi:hypothetical protein
MTDPNRDKAARLLAAVGKEYGQDLTLSEDDTCAFLLEPDIAVILEVPQGLGLIVAYAAIGPVPDDSEARLPVYRALLQRNLLQPMMGGGTIGLDPEGAMFVYALSVSLDGLGARGLNKMLETAYQRALELRDLFALEPKTDDEPEDPNVRRDRAAIIRG